MRRLGSPPRFQVLHSPAVTRQSDASHFVQRGVPLTKLGKLLGQSVLTTTERHPHLGGSALHDAVWLLERLPVASPVVRDMSRHRKHTRDRPTDSARTKSPSISWATNRA